MKNPRDQSPQEVVSKPKADQPQPQYAGGRVLVVDDDESVALTVGELLKRDGLDVDIVLSGEDALAHLERTEYDLVLTDLRMEGVNGIQLITEVHRRAPLTITVVLTGFASVESAVAAMRQGAYDYLIKPCIIDDMRHTVERGLEHRRLVLAEREARASLEQLSRQLLQLQDQERRRIARELHDTTGQSLVALNVNLAIINKSADRLNEKTRRILQESISLIEQCLQEVRTLSYLLHPPVMEELGLASALRWYAEGFTERSGISVELEMQQLPRLAQVTETTLFRIVQECLTNIHRHSGSPTAQIRLSMDSNEIVLEVQDQGRGIPEENLRKRLNESPRLGVGITGMRERVRQLGGELEISSGDGGTTVKTILPLQTSTR
ncbi:MAG TPA: response regulator [Acidobacteriota bacterium]|nr:response regulator [Acidobacteriota bacterium]